MIFRRVLTCFIAASVLTGATALASPQGPIKKARYIPASTGPFWPEEETQTYPTFDATGAVSGTASWRVVTRTGNCCENYLHAMASGRLVNFGGSYLFYSDDSGMNWTRVSGIPMIGGEGAVVGTPEGDILGVGWDPYTGDRLMSVKYTAATGRWDFQESPVHAPFYDRPWISVIPGPFDVAGVSVPYISVVKGGWPYKDPFLISMDGLNYVPVSSPYVDDVAGFAGSFPTTTAYPGADWVQAHLEAYVSPLGAGKAVNSYDPNFDMTSCRRRAFTTGFRWACLPPAANFPYGHLLMDSQGRLHDLIAPKFGDSIQYRISSDNRATWTSRTFALPAGYWIEDVDYKVNGAMGVSAVTIHAVRSSDAFDRDFVFKLDTSTDAASLTKLYAVGHGDVHVDSGLCTDVECPYGRFDFASVVILSNGKIAVSFVDGDHLDPAVAIEL